MIQKDEMLRADGKGREIDLFKPLRTYSFLEGQFLEVQTSTLSFSHDEVV